MNRMTWPKVNGWSLTLITAHGVRGWNHDDGRVVVNGMETLSDEEVDAVSRFLDGEPLNVPEDRQVSDQDLLDLIELDVDTFANEERAA